MAENKEWMKQIFQVVMVVESLDKTIENWKRLVEFDQESIKVGASNDGAECIYKGKKIKCQNKYATFDLGGVEMKLIEPLNKSGGDPYSDSLIKSGQGIHHVGFCANGYDELLETYRKNGAEPIYEEISADKHYLLYDFSAETGLKIAPWAHMEGPCAR